MRKFRAIASTKIKRIPVDSSHLSLGQYLEFVKGEVLEVDDFIETSDEGHLLVKVPLHLFGNHWLEEKPLMLVTQEQARSVYGRALSEQQLQDLNRCCRDFAINTSPRLRHFLSQTAHESGGLKWLVELATGDAYEKRKDLGNVYSGDGRKYKGGGVLQLTGRANYTLLSRKVNDSQVLALGASYVASHYPFTSAGVWWEANGMNLLCDQGASVKVVTRRVNGGYNGLADRERYYQKALAVFP